MVTIARITPADEDLFEQYYQLCRYAFYRLDDTGRREKIQAIGRHSDTFVLLDDDQQVQSGLMVTYFTVNWHGEHFLMGGIGYVGTYPEFSGQGAITKLMHAAYQQMHQKGVILSYLAPFSYAFYRRFGYEEIFDRYHYELPALQFPRLPKKDHGDVKRGDYLTDCALMDDLYQKSDLSQQGALIRQPWWYQYRMSKHPLQKLAFSYNEQKQADGYLVYQRTPGEEFRILEWVSLTSASWLNLAYFMRAHAGSSAKFVYASSRQEPQNDRLPEPEFIKTTLQPYMMVSVLDWQYLLQHWPYPVAKMAPLTLAISNDFDSDNGGIWRFQIRDGQGELQPSTEKQVDLRIDTRQLSKLIFGYRQAGELAAAGQLEVANETVLTRLATCFTSAHKPMLWDYF